VKRAAGVFFFLLGLAVPWAGCSQTTNPINIRSLERSGKAAFLCIRDPKSSTPGQQLEGCYPTPQAYASNDYLVPHTIGLVTQMTRGEVAVVDVTAGSVVDVDPTTPGFNFLPVGALPTDIVATPGSNASFVSIGDANRPAIFALPSTRLLPMQTGGRAPTLASWPACSLPGVPAQMVVVADRTPSTEPGSFRSHCDGSPRRPPAPGLDLSVESALFGTLKLLVMIPERGELLLLDAEQLLGIAPGSFEPCPIERTLVFRADLPPGGADAGGGMVGDADDAGLTSDGAVTSEAGPGGAVCSGRVTPSAPVSREPHPAKMALADDGRLFISDDQASVIHVVDTRDPCAMTEQAPLLPVSAQDPTRAVVTGAIAVSPLTSDRKRFVYAVDLKAGGSVMVFDVSDDSTVRAPIKRPDAPFNPLEPPDRLLTASPVQSLTFATHDVPVGAGDPSNGMIERGHLCDPTTDDPYKPPLDYVGAGAGPLRLRGTFAFLALANGQIAVVDVDDYDRPCRRPKISDDPNFGCDGKLTIPKGGLPSASQEVSCRAVERHLLRSSQFVLNGARTGRHAPAMQAYPLLFDKDGTVLATDPARTEAISRPRLLGPSLADIAPDAQPLFASIGGVDAPVVSEIAYADRSSLHNWVAFDLREPRAHGEQTWTITYEGAIPWFTGHKGRLQCAADKTAIDCERGADASHFVLYDSSAAFCDNGVQGRDIAPTGFTSADIVELLDDFPNPDDPYWGSVADVCSRSICEQAFGTIDAHSAGRDLQVKKAYEDRLELERSADAPPPIGCCFPYPVTYAIRGGKQWIVYGTASGFQHHVIPDPAAADSSTAACVISCDPAKELRNGRVLGRANSQPAPKYADFVAPGAAADPTLFRNPQLRFVVWHPTCAPGCLLRDTYFQFIETGGFSAIAILPPQNALVLPQAIGFVRGLQQLAIPDAASQGLMLFDLNRLGTIKTIY